MAAPILIVDDDVDIRETLAQVLEDEGYAVVTASSGVDALGYLRSGKTPPALILLDLMMPTMHGIEFRAEQAKDPSLVDIPVVIVSASVKAGDTARAMGAAGMIQKPIGLDALLDTVAKFAAR